MSLLREFLITAGITAGITTAAIVGGIILASIDNPKIEKFLDHVGKMTDEQTLRELREREVRNIVRDELLQGVLARRKYFY
ncbi:MAG: hypothetical protein LBK56_04675 [Gracilibacteraceae bacterium]|jgi:hypothetical protein|nr:hypothetical protein [Gracilibacteraceae bacterium]